MENSLLFLYNELMNPDFYNNMRLPLEFISYGIIDGKMYRHLGNKSVFILPYNHQKIWGNTKIYGGLFVCRDIDFYITILDAYHVCYKDKLKRNHIYDMHHRHIVEVTPIYFNTLDDLARLKYREGSSTIQANTYFGNPKHPKIMNRIGKTQSHRVIDGIDADNFKKLFRRVT